MSTYTFKHCVAAALVAGAGSAASGGIWNENNLPPGTSDTGETLASADLTAGLDATLDQINGQMATPDDADLYCIHITNPAAFSATYVGSPTRSTKLALFDSSGFGVAFYSSTPSQPGPALTGLFVTAPGTYFLGVSTDVVPWDATTLALWSTTPLDTERAPDGPAAANPMAGYSPGIQLFINQLYQINLTGASYHIPAPPAALLLGVGGLLAVRRRRLAQ